MSKGRKVPAAPATPKEERLLRKSKTLTDRILRETDSTMDRIWRSSRDEILATLPPDRTAEYHNEFLAHTLSLCIGHMWERECLSLEKVDLQEFVNKIQARLDEHGAWGVKPNSEIIANGIEMGARRQIAMLDLQELAGNDLYRYWQEINRIILQSERIDPTKRVGERGFIYLIKCGTHYKIGKTKDVQSRMKQIGPNQPMPLELIHSIPTDNTHQAEMFFHASFSKARTHGEWFRLTSEQIKMFCAFKEMMYCP